MDERYKHFIIKKFKENSYYIKDKPQKNHPYLGGNKSGYKYQNNLLRGLFIKNGSNKSFSIILLFIISFSIFSQIFASKKFESRGLTTNNYIVLTIKKEGEIEPTIINENFTSLTYDTLIYEDEVYSDINIYKIMWKSPLTSCKDMFKNLTDIISINLTNFDFTSVIDMESFFEECSSLKSVDFGNNNAQNALNMNFMFKNCKSLVSVNLNNFKANKMKNLEQMFYGCENITSIDLSSFDTPELLYLNKVFYGCKSLTYINLSNLKTSKVTNMNGMFAFCESLSSLNLSNFNTESVKTMHQMFTNCSSLISLDLSSFYTPSLQSMHGMFFYCIKLISLDISNFNTTLVTDMDQVFDQCNSLKSLNLSHFYTSSVTTIFHLFYKCNDLEFLDINSFNTDKITNMEGLFFRCQSLKSLNLKSFNTSYVETMNSMFYGCKNLISIDLSSFNTRSVKNMNAMFRDCYNLKSLDLNHFYTPKLENMSEMFAYCHALESLDIRNFNTSKITNMSLLFYNCMALTSLNVQNFDTSSVNDMNGMFRGLYSLISLNLSNFNTELVTNMNQMFDQCRSLTSLDISNFHTPLVTNMKNMFYNCFSLNYLDVRNLNTDKIQNFETMFNNCSSLTYLNLSSFNTSSAVTMTRMFDSCKKLIYLDLKNFYTPSLLEANKVFYACNRLEWLDISNFDISKVTDISNFFGKCHNLTSLDIQNFDTKSVKNMEYLFHNCPSLKSINLSHFDTSNVVSTKNMFHQCLALTSLDLSNFNTTLVTNMEKMFYRCDSLKYLDVSNFNTGKVTNMISLFSLTKVLISLNLSSFDIYDETDVTEILLNSNPNLILCYNESKMPNSFLVQARSYQNSCKQLCIMNNKKYFFDKEMCVENCFDETVYKFEYQDICYTNCPIRTQVKADSTYLCEDCPNYYNYEGTECINEIPEGYYANSSSEKTIDKCPSKCGNCSLESINYDLCKECNINDNYYRKFHDLSINNFIQCYHTSEMQIDYYLDNVSKIYKPCYYKCKKCSREGNDDDNYCEECKDDYIYDNGNCHLKTTESSIIINYLTTSSNTIEETEDNTKVNSLSINSNIIEETENNYIIELVSSYLSMNNTHVNNSPAINIGSTIFETLKEEPKYFYDISSISEEVKHNKTQVYIDVNQEIITSIKQKFSLDDEQKIFINIIEKNNEGSNIATTDYIYKFTLENGTVLNMSSTEEDIYVDTYVPIKDLEKAKVNLVKKFAEQGYDIYDINSDFYQDFCTPASMEGNDISLDDRINDIYPHNVTLCKSNCKYNGINLEEQRVICLCNINSNKKVDNENEIPENDGNFITYLLDNINYKLFKCYKLFFNINYLKKSYAFYIILIIYFIISIFNCIYIIHTLEKLKIYMGKKMFENDLIYLRNNSDSKKIKPTFKSTISNANPKKKKASNNTKNKKMNKKDNDASNKTTKIENNLFIYVLGEKKKKISEKIEKNDFVNIKNKNIKNFKKTLYEESNKDYLQITKQKMVEENEGDMNELPYSKALFIDKRNIFCIFFSFVIGKLELINIFVDEHIIKIILFEEFILALLINFFFNALLFTDDVVSNKYHNNGKLDIIVTLILSIISNIVTSIFCYYIKYSRGIEERVKSISQIKRKYHFYRNMQKLFLELKIKFVCFFVYQIIIIATCIYYLVIFGVKYPCSQKSLILNYFYSLVESIITSFGIALIVSIIRKIGLSYSNKRLYNASKFIDSKF